MFVDTVLLFDPDIFGEERTYLSCRMTLFSFFQASLKSVENSCHTEKKVLGETSFSPLLALTEKKQHNSRNLQKHQHHQTHVLLTNTPLYIKLLCLCSAHSLCVSLSCVSSVSSSVFAVKIQKDFTSQCVCVWGTFMNVCD